MKTPEEQLAELKKDLSKYHEKLKAEHKELGQRMRFLDEHKFHFEHRYVSEVRSALEFQRFEFENLLDKHEI